MGPAKQEGAREHPATVLYPQPLSLEDKPAWEVGKQLLPETLPEMADKLEVTPGVTRWSWCHIHCDISQERTQVENTGW